MTDDELIDLTNRLRLAQRLFDREKTTAALREMRTLEQRLDEALRARKVAALRQDVVSFAGGADHDGR